MCFISDCQVEISGFRHFLEDNPAPVGMVNFFQPDTEVQEKGRMDIFFPSEV